MSAGEKLRKNLKEKKNFLVLGGVLPIEFLQMKANGLKLGYLSGAALSNSLGMLDEGILNLSRVERAVLDITDVCTLPLIVDCDTGLCEKGTNPKNNLEEYDAVEKMARTMEEAGAAAIQIEDQVPAKKRCGHLPEKELVSMEKMFWKVRVAKLKSRDLVIVARTDSRSVEGLDKAIWRAHRYQNAGADAIFPEALESLEEFIAFRKAIPNVPLVANLAEMGKTPQTIKASDLFAIGYQIVLIPATLFRIMQKKLVEIAKVAKHFGSLRGYVVDGELIPRNELNEFIKQNSEHYKTLAN